MPRQTFAAKYPARLCDPPVRHTNRNLYAVVQVIVEGTYMNQRNILHQEQHLDEILFSDRKPTDKVQQIIRLGFDPEVADEIVEHHLNGAQSPVYYERLDFADLDDIDEPEFEQSEDRKMAA